MFIGANISGLIVNHYSIQLKEVITYNWDNIWMIPAVFSLIIFIIFGLLFKDKVNKKEKKPEMVTT